MIQFIAFAAYDVFTGGPIWIWVGLGVLFGPILKN